MHQISFTTAVVSLLICSSLVGCDGSNSRKVEKKKADPMKFALMAGELIPTAAGGAYLYGTDVVYFISGETITPVVGLPSELLGADVVPLADGGAILKLPFAKNQALFRLEGAQAHPIVASAASPQGSSQLPQSGHWFAQSQRAHSQIKHAESRLSSDIE